MAARRSTLYLGDWDEGQEALDKVEVRGCFDHLHDGHKELLETAVLVANEKLIVAIIADPNKGHSNMIPRISRNPPPHFELYISNPGIVFISGNT